jgi:uncharacterized protein YjdB
MTRRLQTLAVLGWASLLITCSESTSPSVKVASVSVSPDSALIDVLDSINSTATARDANGKVVPAVVTWSSRDGRIATVRGDGWIRAIHGGRTWILATAGAATDSLLVIGRGRGTTIVAPHSDSLYFIRETGQLQAHTSDSSGTFTGSYTWFSRDPAVASVNQVGVITAHSVGDAFILAIEDDGSRDSAHVVVQQRVASVVVAPGTSTRPVARTQHFTATVLDSGATIVPSQTVVWSSSLSSVAGIDSTGLATAVAVGTDSIRAQVGTVTGRAVLQVSPLSSLHFDPDTLVLGVGQFATSLELPVPRLIADSAGLDQVFAAHLTAGDTTIAAPPESLIVPGQSGNYTSFTFAGRRAGATTFTAAAPRYNPATAVVRVSTPRLVAGVYSPGDTISLFELATLGAGVADSQGHDHHLVSPVTIQMISRDTTVLVPDTDTLVVPAGSVGAFGTLTPRSIGQAWVIMSAAGYRRDSVLVTVVSARLKIRGTLGTSPSPATIGVGQGFDFAYIYTGFRPDTGLLTVTLRQRHPERVQILASDTLQIVGPGGALRADWAGIGLGADTIVASAPGYAPDTLFVIVTTPTYQVCNFPVTIRADGRAFPGFVASDSAGRMHAPLVPTYAHATSSDTTILQVQPDTVGIIDAQCGSSGTLVFPGYGSATITLSDPRGIYKTYVTPPIVVTPAAIVWGLGLLAPVDHVALGMRQAMSRDSIPLVQLVGSVGGIATVHFRSTAPAVAHTAISQSQIVEGRSLEIFGGDTTGTAWIVAEGQQFTPDSIRVDVGHSQLVIHGRQPGTGIVDTVHAFSLWVRDQLGNRRVPAEDVTADISTSNFSALGVDSTHLTIRAMADESGVSGVYFLNFGVGAAVIRAIDPRLPFYHYDPGSFGPLLGP